MSEVVQYTADGLVFPFLTGCQPDNVSLGIQVSEQIENNQCSQG